MTTYTFNVAASARVYATEDVEFDTLEEAIAHARTIDPGDFDLRLDDESTDREGDEIVYILTPEGDEHIVDIADEGQPYAWVAADIVKALAKLNPTDTTDLTTLIASAKRACTRQED